jgi:hypothetical protein
LPERISFNSFLSFDLEKMLLKNSWHQNDKKSAFTNRLIGFLI